MPEERDLDRRLRAVERAVTNGDHDLAALQDAATLADRLDDLEDRIAALEDRTDELDAATQAVRGYVGNVRSVNEAVEERADAALAAVDRIEARLDEAEGRSDERPRGVERGENQQASRTRPTSRTRLASGESADRNDSHGPEFGIEMPPPGRDSHQPTADDGNDDRSVIQRVREVL